MADQQLHSLGPAVGWETDAEWELEQATFVAANCPDIPEDVRSLIKQLWHQYCLAARATHEAKGISEETTHEDSNDLNRGDLCSGVSSDSVAQLGVWPGDAGPIAG